MPRVYPNPKFASEVEEESYWEGHSPLLEGYEGVVQRPRRGRLSSFLSLRLTGEELELLRQRAEHLGVGPSTLARQLLLQALRAQGTLEEVRSRLRELEQKVARLAKEKVPATASGPPPAPR